MSKLKIYFCQEHGIDVVDCGCGGSEISGWVMTIDSEIFSDRCKNDVLKTVKEDTV